MPVTLISDKRQLHLQRLNVRSENTDLLELQLHRPHLVLKERNALLRLFELQISSRS